jgi:PAS domain S-box-containing protein
VNGVKKPHEAMLRRRAETSVREDARGAFETMSPQHLVHELQVHQVELEMQNDELRQTSLALQESRDRYHANYELAPVAHVILGPGDTIVEANLFASALLGVRRALLLGRPFPAFLSPADADAFYLYRQNLLANEASAGCELTLLATSGRKIPVRIDAEAFATAGASQPSYRCVLVDLSDIRDYQEKLREMSFDATLGELRERRRIAGDVHDRVGQALALTQMTIAGVRGETGGDVKKALDRANDLLERAVHDVRALTFELHPPILYDLGLGAALYWLAEQLEEAHGIAVQVDAEPNAVPRTDVELSSLLFGIVRELLTNVVTHARTGRAHVTMQTRDGDLVIEVVDRGVGFDPKATARGGQGFGLFRLRERVRRLGGRFDLVSAPGKGTTARIVLPYDGEMRKKLETGES